ncbi:hypothetical protein FKM82_015112 [Ascaphus truei]
MQRAFSEQSESSQCLGTSYALDTENSELIHLEGSSKMATVVPSTAQQLAAVPKWRLPPILDRAREACKETVREMWREMCRGLAPNPDPLKKERRESQSPPTCAVTGRQTRPRHTERRSAPPFVSTRGRGHKESQSEVSSPAKGGTGSESEELHFCLAFEEQGAETLNCSTTEQITSKLSTTTFQLPGGFLVVETDGREYLRCLCIHCRTPGQVPSTKARCPQCGMFYLWPNEPWPMIKTPRGASLGTLTEVAETADEAALVPCTTTEVGTKAQPTTEPRETPAEKSATAVEVPERARFLPIPTGGEAKDPGDSIAEDPIQSSSEENGVSSVAMRLPTNHPSCKNDGSPLTGEREQTSPDTPRRRALVRPKARRSPTAVVTPSAVETGSETAPEEAKSISQQQPVTRLHHPLTPARQRRNLQRTRERGLRPTCPSADRMIHHRPFRFSTHFRCVTTERMEILRAPTTSLSVPAGTEARRPSLRPEEPPWQLHLAPLTATAFREEHEARRQGQAEKCPLVVALPDCWTLIRTLLIPQPLPLAPLPRPLPLPHHES